MLTMFISMLAKILFVIIHIYFILKLNRLGMKIYRIGWFKGTKQKQHKCL